MRTLQLSAALVLCLAGGPALAGPVPDYEATFQQTDAAYQAVLASTGAGDSKKANAALGQLEDGLIALQTAYGSVPVKDRADDPLWPDTMTKVLRLVSMVRSDIQAGQIGMAHDTLSALGELIGELNPVNGIASFSDRMTAYHGEMQRVLAFDGRELDTDAIGTLRERAAVLDYLAQDVLRAPPPKALSSPDYQALAADFQISVSNLLAAVQLGDVDQIHASIAGLNDPYSKLFAKFG